MGWKIRNGRRYYYRSIREGGRVRSEYVGAGWDAGLIAEIESAERGRREAAAADWRAERGRLDAEDRAQAGRFGRVEVLARLALEAAGFRRHKRGEWRRRRMGDSTEDPALARPPAPPAPPDEIRDVLTRASRGDESAMPRLRELFAADPARMLEACRGDLAEVAEDAALSRMAGRNLVLREAVGRKLAALRGELAGPGASPAERLLAERVALCWLDCHDWEIRHNQAWQAEGGLTPRAAAHYQKMRDHAHRRYLQALKTLATVRKLGPAIQINLARQQVNVAGG